jgi:hypothetical protein
MKADQLRDLRVALLRELYRVQPLGRRAPVLHQLVRQEVACHETDVAAQLAFLEGNHFICQVKADDISAGLDPFWFITTAGMVHCEEKHFV